MILFGIFTVLALISLAAAIAFWRDAKKHGWNYISDEERKKFDEATEKYNTELQEFKDGKRDKEPKKPVEPSTNKQVFGFVLIAFVIFAALAGYNHPLTAEEQTQVDQQKEQAKKAEERESAAQKEQEQQAVENQKKADALLATYKIVTDIDEQLMSTVSNPMKATLDGLSDGSVDRYAAYSQFKAQYDSASKLDSDFIGKKKVAKGMDSDDEDKIEQAMDDYESAIDTYRSAARILADATNKGFTPKALDEAKTELQAGNALKLQAVTAFVTVSQKYGAKLPGKE